MLADDTYTNACKNCLMPFLLASSALVDRLMIVGLADPSTQNDVSKSILVS